MSSQPRSSSSLKILSSSGLSSDGAAESLNSLPENSSPRKKQRLPANTHVYSTCSTSKHPHIFFPTPTSLIMGVPRTRSVPARSYNCLTSLRSLPQQQLERHRPPLALSFSSVTPAGNTSLTSSTRSESSSFSPPLSQSTVWQTHIDDIRRQLAMMERQHMILMALGQQLHYQQQQQQLEKQQLELWMQSQQQ